MMAENNENRSTWLKIRLKPSELHTIEKRYHKSAFQNLSEFGRAMLLGKPVTVLNRDRSMDEILEELIVLRKELNAIGNNLNQAVRNINKLHGLPDQRLWTILLKVVKTGIEPKITHIKNRLDQYADLWLQRSKAAKVLPGH